MNLSIGDPFDPGPMWPRASIVLALIGLAFMFYPQLRALVRRALTRFTIHRARSHRAIRTRRK
jgi:hypothetical protein